jgi:hypothetical protein
MIYTITRTLQGTATTTLSRGGEFVLNPLEADVAVFKIFDEALTQVVGLQVKHDLAIVKSPCTYALNRLAELSAA